MIQPTLFSILALSSVHEPQAAPDGACATWLQRAESAAASQHYVLDSRDKSGLAGRSKRGSRLDATCEPGYAQLRIVDAEGSSVSLEFSGTPGENHFSLQISGDFPGVGQVARTHIFEVDGSEIEGFTNYSAATADDFASMDLAPDGSATRFVGEAARANAEFAPKLSQSIAWKEANRFLYGLAGMLEDLQPVAGEADQTPMDSLFSLAIPTPHSEARDQDAAHGLRTCGATAATCVLAIFFPPVGGACISLSALCFAAEACYAADCAGDG